MKMIVLMQAEEGAAKEGPHMAPFGMVGSSLKMTTWLWFQRSEGKAGSKLL